MGQMLALGTLLAVLISLLCPGPDTGQWHFLGSLAHGAPVGPGEWVL